MDAPLQQSDCSRCGFLERELAAARSLVAELRAQVQAQREELAALRKKVEDLTARLNSNSNNSSRPPSSDYFKQPRPKAPSGRKRGGQKGHRGHHRQRLPAERVDHFVHHLPQSCHACQGPLPPRARPCDPTPRWHQVAEVPPLAANITEHQAHGRLCSCGQITYASIPPEVSRHCFGPRLTALISYLSARCHDSKRTIQEILADVLGVPIALGSVTAKEQEMRKALARPYAQAQRQVRRADVKHVDETSWASCGQLRWLWVAATGKAALYRVHRRRTAKALARLLGTKQIGTIVTDRHGAYSRWPASRRQLCWAHLKRDFTRWRERGTGLGRTGLSVCRAVFGLWRDFRQGRLDAASFSQKIEPVKKRLRRLLAWWREKGSGPPYAFARNLLSVHAALWTFATPAGIARGVEPTNNHAERVLRPAVLWRKNSFASQGQNGCHFAERILTAVHTLRLQGRNVLDYLTEAIAARRAGLRAPRLIAR